MDGARLRLLKYARPSKRAVKTVSLSTGPSDARPQTSTDDPTAPPPTRRCRCHTPLSSGAVGPLRRGAVGAFVLRLLLLKSSSSVVLSSSSVSWVLGIGFFFVSFVSSSMGFLSIGFFVSLVSFSFMGFQVSGSLSASSASVLWVLSISFFNVSFISFFSSMGS